MLGAGRRVEMDPTDGGLEVHAFQDSIARTITGTATVIPSGDMARKAYYDRNSALEIQTYAATLGEHSVTVRWTYTVPADHKALHSVLFGRCQTDIATATKYCSIGWEGLVYGDAYKLFNVMIHYDGSGFLTTQTATVTFALNEGDAVRGYTFSGDTVDHYMNVASLLTEFDA